jgi:hypothetical protein
MTRMHLHILDAQTGIWEPATTTGVSAGLGGGAGRASADDWSYAAASGGITDTSDVTLVAAQGNGYVNYLTALQIRNADASVATEVVIKSGASDILWRIDLDANSPMMTVEFPQPLRAATNTALTAACITTSSETYVNAQGYTDWDAELIDQQYATDVNELLSSIENNITLHSGTFLHVGGP